MIETFLLAINASILWGVLAGLLTWLLRFKTLVLVLLLAPLVIGSTFRQIGVDSGRGQDRIISPTVGVVAANHSPLLPRR